MWNGQNDFVMGSFFETNKDHTTLKGHSPLPKEEVTSNIFFQPKLTVGPTDDVYEREADAVAEQVVSGSSADVQRKISTVDVQPKCTACEEEEKLQRKCAKCGEEEKLQRKEVGNSPGGDNAPSIVHDALASPGKAIDTETRSFMEGRWWRAKRPSRTKCVPRRSAAVWKRSWRREMF